MSTHKSTNSTLSADIANHLDYPINANSEFIVDEEYLDFEHQSEQLSGCDQRYYQLSCGGFRGRFISASPGCQISFHIEHANQRLQQFVGFPNNRVSLGLVVNAESSPFIANGLRFGFDDLLVCQAGCEMNLLSPPDGTVMAISIASTAVESFSENLFKQVFSGQKNSAVSVYKSRELARSLRRDAFIAIDTVRQLSTSHNVGRLGTVENATISSILGQLDLHLSAESATSGQTQVSSYLNYHLTLTHLMRLHSGTINYPELSAVTGLSRRSMQLAFANFLQMTPTKYSRIIRLHMARRALIEERHDRRSIGDVAEQFGFSSWSRFTHHYAELFEELPSITRNRPG